MAISEDKAWHINPYTGKEGRCSATESCPFGGRSGRDDHYPTAEAARAAYEDRMKEKAFTSFSKNIDNSGAKVKKLKNGYRVNHKKMFLPQGFYYVGDIGRVVNNSDPELWNAWVRESNEEGGKSIAVGAEILGEQLTAIRVHSRGYRTPYKKVISTESGYIGAVPMSLLNSLHANKEDYSEDNGEMVYVDSDSNLSILNGVISVGEKFKLPVFKSNPNFNEEEEKQGNTPMDDLIGYYDEENPFNEYDLKDVDHRYWTLEKR